MTAEATDKPEQRAPGALVVFNARQAATARAGRLRRGAFDHLCLGSTCGRSAGIGATVSFCIHLSRTSSSRQAGHFHGIAEAKKLRRGAPVNQDKKL